MKHVAHEKKFFIHSHKKSMLHHFWEKISVIKIS